jgi:hypothetical protein
MARPLILMFLLMACHSNRKKDVKAPIYYQTEEEAAEALIDELFEDDLDDLPEAGEAGSDGLH